MPTVVSLPNNKKRHVVFWSLENSSKGIYRSATQADEKGILPGAFPLPVLKLSRSLQAFFKGQCFALRGSRVWANWQTTSSTLQLYLYCITLPHPQPIRACCASKLLSSPCAVPMIGIAHCWNKHRGMQKRKNERKKSTAQQLLFVGGRKMKAHSWTKA